MDDEPILELHVAEAYATGMLTPLMTSLMTSPMTTLTAAALV